MQSAQDCSPQLPVPACRKLQRCRPHHLYLPRLPAHGITVSDRYLKEPGMHASLALACQGFVESSTGNDHCCEPDTDELGPS